MQVGQEVEPDHHVHRIDSQILVEDVHLEGDVDVGRPPRPYRREVLRTPGLLDIREQTDDSIRGDPSQL
jgi:hypothetical protein